MQDRSNEIVFENRPGMDGGKQGKSPLPYYMDEEGDVANEFYEEVNCKLVRVSESKLKQV
jgi:Tumour suppressor candidate 2